MTTVWTEQYKHPITYLLLEEGGYLLLEEGGKLVLEETGTSTSLWTEETKH